MSQIYVYQNSLNKNEVDVIDTDNILYEFLKVKKQFPQAKIYHGNPCPENDITPSLKDKSSIARLTEIADDCSIVCHPGELSSFVTWVATKILGSAVSALVKVPKPNMGNNGSMSGSSNNNLSDPENRQRLKQRIPFILGRVKAIPDLFAPVIKYFKDGVEVEESLMCICENPVQV
ncbi:host specificity factor TipJ family phage tail protein, partial [Acinetobacter baumannii]